MPIIIYGTAISAPTRAVWLAAEALGIELDNRETNLANGDHKKEDFLKRNPQHTVPTMDDDGFYLCDSHAIICYFINKYGQNDELYPKEPHARAKVEERLHFNNSVLFANLNFICKPVFRNRKDRILEDEIKQIKACFNFLDKFLEKSNWLVGENYTLVDMACIATVTNLTVFVSLERYPNVKAWLKRCEQQLPGYAKWNKPGSDQFHQAILSKLKDAERFPLI